VASTYGFNLNDAKRIARSVRLVERDEPRQDLAAPQLGAVSRGVRLLLAKHAGSSWPASSSAVVTVYNGEPGSLTTAITLVAHNQFLEIATGTSCTNRWVALGHNGFGWYAIAFDNEFTNTCTTEVAGYDFAKLPGYDRTKIQLLGHNSGATATGSTDCVSIRWYDITTCSTAA